MVSPSSCETPQATGKLTLAEISASFSCASTVAAMIDTPCSCSASRRCSKPASSRRQNGHQWPLKNRTIVIGEDKSAGTFIAAPPTSCRVISGNGSPGFSLCDIGYSAVMARKQRIAYSYFLFFVRIYLLKIPALFLLLSNISTDFLGCRGSE